METKAFEVRDAATFISVLATRMVPTASPGSDEGGSEFYLLRRSGFLLDDPPPLVMLCRMEAAGNPLDASYDAYSWGRTRTMQVAHNHITAFWDKLKSGDVIDVEFILGETKTKKRSEYFSSLPASGVGPPAAGPSHPSGQPDAGF